jgi:uncharacterized delta-60 repeat protein
MVAVCLLRPSPRERTTVIRNSRLRVEPLEDRLAPAAGQLVPTCSGDGIVTLPRGSGATSSATYPDGRILAPVQGGLERLLPDGSPDTTFGTGGIAADPTSGAPTPLPDGGALSLKQFATVNGGQIESTIQVTRYTPAGALDPTFGTNGTAVVWRAPGSLDKHVTVVGVQPDGSVLLVGRQDLSPGTAFTARGMLVTRLTPAGQFDPTFGQGGTVLVPFPVGQFNTAEATAIAVQPDGRIVVAGNAVATMSKIPGNTDPVPQQTPVAVRLTAAGQLDPTFGAGGRVLVALPQGQTPSAAVHAVSVLANGDVLLAGKLDLQATNTKSGLAVRLTAAGQPDPTFDADGLATTPSVADVISSSWTTFDAGIDPFGRVVFSSYTVGRGALFAGSAVYRLTAGGSSDPGFGTDGRVVTTSVPGLSGAFLEVVGFQPDGNIILGWTASQSSGMTVALARLLGSNPPAGFVPAVAGTIAVGGAANGSVQALNPAGGAYSAAGTMTVYAGFGGNVRSATADVTGDGTPDYITGVGPGGPPGVTVFDGKTGNTVADVLAFESGFTGGVFVAAADLDGDGRAEVVVAPDQGGGPRVVVFSIAPGGAATMRASFFGIDDPNFRGGARVALGDVNHDGTADLAVAAGFLGGPRVALFDGTTLFSGNPVRLVGDFFAFPGEDATRLRNGVFVSIGDVSGDGFAELVFAGGPGGAPRVFILNGQLVSGGDVAGAQASPVANFFVAGNDADRGGVRVAVKDADGDAKADLTVGSGEGSPANVRIYLGKDFTSAAEPIAFQDLAVFGGAALPGGVFVG